jgi:hypothetical protein
VEVPRSDEEEPEEEAWEAEETTVDDDPAPEDAEAPWNDADCAVTRFQRFGLLLDGSNKM